MLEIGSSLWQARQRQKLTLAQVEAAIRIRASQLEALEQERFELLPPDPYRRSFLREYAQFLGLDGDLYAYEYERRFRPPEPQLPTPPPQRSLRQPPRSRLLAAAAAATLLTLLALLALVTWALGRPGGSGPGAPTTPVRVHARTPPSHARPGPVHAHANKPPATLQLRAARGTCWLWVRLGSSRGKTLDEQTLQPGQTLRLGLRKPLWIRFGAPSNLDATISHKPLTLPSQTADVLITATGPRPPH